MGLYFKCLLYWRTNKHFTSIRHLGLVIFVQKVDALTGVLVYCSTPVEPFQRLLYPVKKFDLTECIGFRSLLGLGTGETAITRGSDIGVFQGFERAPP